MAWSTVRDGGEPSPSILDECSRPGGRGATFSVDGCSRRSAEVPVHQSSFPSYLRTDFTRTLFLSTRGTATTLASEGQAGKVYRIGVLSPESPPPGLLNEFEQELRMLGYISGKNIAVELRHAEGRSERLAALAGEFVRLKVDVVLAVNTSINLGSALEAFILEPEYRGELDAAVEADRVDVTCGARRSGCWSPRSERLC
jgi:hypothetical protein